MKGWETSCTDCWQVSSLLWVHRLVVEHDLFEERRQDSLTSRSESCKELLTTQGKGVALPFRVPVEERLPARLVEAARETRRLWASDEILDSIEAALLTQEVADDLIREAVGSARSIGTPWEHIAARLGASRQAAWQKFNFADETEARILPRGREPSGDSPPGRQAYFRTLLVQILKEDPRGAPVAIDDLYAIVSETAEPGWVDDAPCRHNKAQCEWQHDLRWSLLQLKGRGDVRQPARGQYELAL